MKKTIRFWVVLGMMVSMFGGIIIATALLRNAINSLPEVNKLEDYVPPLVTQVVDWKNQTIGEFFTERRTSIPFSQIPNNLKLAVIAIEDTAFREHWGINPKGILRATVANLRAGRLVQGGSTLTQQLAKTIFLTRQKTFDRKFKEFLLTLQMEQNYSKDEILELYLNQIYFGGGAYGVEAASRLYFNKHTEELDLSECSLLAGLIRSPNRYSPLNNPERARDRRATVLHRMRELNFITDEQEQMADNTAIQNVGSGLRVKEAPYFVEEIRKMLEPIYGSEQLEQGGLVIQTTIDANLQRVAESVLEQHLSDYDMKFGTATLIEYKKELEKSTTTRNIEVSTTPPRIQGALVAMDVHTGAIRAMVGGRDFYKSQFNRAIQAKRQPGSSFKPFVYGASLENGFTAASVINDAPLVYTDMESNPRLLAETTTYAETMDIILTDALKSQAEFDKMKKEEKDAFMKHYWRPQNFDNKNLGPLTLRNALQKSRNLVTVRLITAIGPRTAARFAHAAGIKSDLSAVLSLGLGTSVVNLLELTNAYGTLASGGIWADSYYIEKISDRHGKILEEHVPKVEARLNPQTCFLIVNIMKGVVERGTGWYARRLGRPLAGKTGTTQDQRDLLFIGFSPDLVCGVWVGYDDFRPLKRGLSASNIAVPMWTEFMREALKGYAVKDFPIPPKIEFAKIDADTGLLALPTCPKVILEAFREKTVPSEFCPVDHINAAPPAPDQELE